jgi:hypothetical protein
MNSRSIVESTQATSKPGVDVNPGQAWGEPAYWPCGVRHRGSVRLIWAPTVKCGNLRSRCTGKGTSAKREAENTDARSRVGATGSSKETRNTAQGVRSRIAPGEDANRVLPRYQSAGQVSHGPVHVLGYPFRPRTAVDKYGRVYVNFSPGVSREALTAMRHTVRGWHLQLMNDKELSDLSNMFGPVLRGWSNYYGRFYPSAMKPLWRHMNGYLVRWMQRKYKRLARGVIRAAGALGQVAEGTPQAFVHWEKGFLPAAR